MSDIRKMENGELDIPVAAVISPGNFEVKSSKLEDEKESNADLGMTVSETNPSVLMNRSLFNILKPFRRQLICIIVLSLVGVPLAFMFGSGQLLYFLTMADIFPSYEVWMVLGYGIFTMSCLVYILAIAFASIGLNGTCCGNVESAFVHFRRLGRVILVLLGIMLVIDLFGVVGYTYWNIDLGIISSYPIQIIGYFVLPIDVLLWVLIRKNLRRGLGLDPGAEVYGSESPSSSSDPIITRRTRNRFLRLAMVAMGSEEEAY